MNTSTSVHLRDGDPVHVQVRAETVVSGPPYVELTFGRDGSDVTVYLSPVALRVLGALVDDAQEELSRGRNSRTPAVWPA